MIRAALLDMDGLMIDSEPLYWAAERAIATQYDTSVSDETLRSMMGHSPLESIRIFKQALGLAPSADELLAQRDGLVLGGLRREVEAQPGLTDFLDRFRGRLRLAVVTGAPRSFVDVVLERIAVGEAFDLIQTSDDVERGKPDPEIYLKAAARLSVAPADCVVLEDSVNGALAGKRAGAYTIAVPSEQTRGQDFSFADYVAVDLSTAAAHIQRMLSPKP